MDRTLINFIRRIGTYILPVNVRIPVVFTGSVGRYSLETTNR